MFLDVGRVRTLGVPEAEATVRIAVDVQSADRAVGGRFLRLADRPAFELAFPCGTCPLLFDRRDGANTRVSLDDPDGQLAAGLTTVDNGVVERYGGLLPNGLYQPLLLKIAPRLVAPAGSNDYFTHEQVATWGIDGFSGAPESPGTPYYRTFETRIDDDQHLYEFVVPMVPPTWNAPDRVDRYAEVMAAGAVPTAVALSFLDVLQPAMDDDSTDYYTHWGLTHFLLDGHHKLHAAARTGTPITLLTLLAHDDGLADPEDLTRLLSIRADGPARRTSGERSDSP